MRSVLHITGPRDMIMIMSSLASVILYEQTASRSLSSGEVLFARGENVTRLHLLVEGEIMLERIAEDGRRLVLQRARAGDVLAEASFFAGTYHCDAFARSASHVASADIGRLKRLGQSDISIMEVIARHLGTKVQEARARAEMLSLKRVDQRVDAWLVLNNGQLPFKGHWQTLAGEIGVTPEALYRELARRGRS